MSGRHFITGRRHAGERSVSRFMDRKSDPWIEFYPQHLHDGGVNPRHLLCAEKGEGARDQALVLDGADLIDQKVGIPIQAIAGAETHRLPESPLPGGGHREDGWKWYSLMHLLLYSLYVTTQVAPPWSHN